MKKLAKTCVIGLTSMLVLSAAMPVWADQTAPRAPELVESATKMTIGKALVDSDVPVHATVSKEQAIQLAKKYVQVPDRYKLQGVGYQDSNQNGDHGTWNLSFIWQEKDRYRGDIYIGIDSENGAMISFRSQENDPTKQASYPPKVNLNSGKDIAWKFVEKINPQGQGEVQYNTDFEKKYKPTLTGVVQYMYTYERVVNEVVFPQNYIQVVVDGNGHVVSYDYRWNEQLTFAKPNQPISADQAKAAFIKEMGLQLVYVLPYQSPERAPILSYETNTFHIDAHTGEPIHKPLGMQLDPSPLAKKPSGKKPVGDLQLTKEQAAQKVKDSFKLPNNAKLEEANYYEDIDNSDNKTSFWNFRWTAPADASDQLKEDMAKRIGYPYPDGSIHATVNSATGEIRNYSDRGNIIYLQMAQQDAASSPSELKASVTYEQAKVKAINTVKKLLPYYADQLYLINDQDVKMNEERKIEEQPTFSFSFKRKVHGALTESDNINLELDRVTGEVSSYYANIHDYDYPDKAPLTISAAKAKDLLLSQYRIEKRYVYDENNTMYSHLPNEKILVMIAAGELDRSVLVKYKDESQVESNEAQLVYALVSDVYTDEPFFLEATKGEWINRQNGQPATLERVIATDITNHAAELELQLMIDYKALDVVNGKVNPDQAMTRGEMIKMLIIAMNGGPRYYATASKESASFADVKQDSAFFGYVEEAAAQNLIDADADTFRPDAMMIRDDMAELVVRALGLNKLAGYDQLFAIQFKDEAQVKHKGHAAIALGLGIMTMMQNNFEPDHKVTRSDAAQTFVRYLQKRADLVDRPLGAY